MNKQITEYLLPKRIADVSQNVLNSATLLYEKSAQIALDETDVCIATGGFVLLDFGREISGGVRILCHKAGRGSTVVRIRFGESYGEANAELAYKGACNDHSPRDFSATIVNDSDLTFGQTGFRFVRIDFPEGERVAIKSVYAVFTHYSGASIGDFVCSDELINKIYDTARYTVMLNMQNGVIWDGIKRDRLVWVGDMYPEVKAILYTYGGEDCIKKFAAICHANQSATRLDKPYAVLHDMVCRYITRILLLYRRRCVFTRVCRILICARRIVRRPCGRIRQTFV